MAVHCGVCGTRIFEQWENEGGFQVNADFKGWNKERAEPGRTALATIQDTCEDCAKELRKVVTEAANKIVEMNRERVALLRDELLASRETQRKLEQDKIRFEQDWWAKQRSGT